MRLHIVSDMGYIDFEIKVPTMHKYMMQSFNKR